MLFNNISVVFVFKFQFFLKKGVLKREGEHFGFQLYEKMISDFSDFWKKFNKTWWILFFLFQVEKIK
jgi:hypothetical protein